MGTVGFEHIEKYGNGLRELPIRALARVGSRRDVSPHMWVQIQRALVNRRPTFLAKTCIRGESRTTVLAEALWLDVRHLRAPDRLLLDYWSRGGTSLPPRIEYFPYRYGYQNNYERSDHLPFQRGKGHFLHNLEFSHLRLLRPATGTEH